MKIKIFEEDDKGKEFWGDMGYFFARREIRREMPYLIDDAGYVWFVVYGKSGDIAAFASCHIDKKKVGHLHGVYVRQESRRTGLYNKLTDQRLNWMKKKDVKSFTVTANENSKVLLEKKGFVEVKQKGQYTVMSLDMDKEDD